MRHENKNRMRRLTIFHNYCRYYSRCAIVVMTVLTTVARENRMRMHAIFIVTSHARCPATILRKNRPSWTTTTTTMTRRSAQCSTAQKSGEPSDDERASHVSAVVAAIAGTSCERAGSSHIVGTLRNHVSLGPRKRVVTTVPGNAIVGY